MDIRQNDLIDRHGIITADALVDPKAKARAAAEEANLGPVFYTWLEANWPIWFAFCRLADAMRNKGRKYYSARAVMEVVRWHRHLSDSLEITYKINDHITPKLARTYNRMIGSEFFRERDSA